MQGRRTNYRVQGGFGDSRGLKAPRELNAPVIAPSQLSRAVEGARATCRCLDLRGSGCLAGETLIYFPDQGIYRQDRRIG
jgi:replicative DNA helicase